MSMILRAFGFLCCLTLCTLAVPGIAQTSSASTPPQTTSSEAPATSLSAILDGFTSDSFGDTSTAIAAIAAGGQPRAAVILDALKSGHLLFTGDPKGVYLKDANDHLFDAATGAPVAKEPDNLSDVRLNNRVRGVLSAALGTVLLAAPEPAKRIAAAQSIFKSRDASALPALTAALANEKDASVKTAMNIAASALIALKADMPVEKRIAAIKTVASQSDSEAMAILQQVSDSSSGDIKAAADSARASINFKMKLWNYAQNAWYGLSLGSVLLLAAIGLAITFGVMGVINMAHGEMVMLGAYATFVTQEVIRSYCPALFDYSLLFAVPVAFIFTAFAGVLIERCIIRFLYGRPLETLLATFGLSLILQQAVRTVFGANNKDVGAPAFMAGTTQIGGLSITYGRFWIIIFALAVFAALQMLLRLTSFGLRIRAVTQNRRMASAIGINTNRIDAMAFGLGSGVAGIAGVALSQIDNVSPNLGQSYIIDSFMVVVFGGVGNLWGTLVAAFALGIGNKFLEPLAGAVLGKIAILVFIILFIQKRPRGLFALKGRAVEA
jgi:urea transport system permease protein